jgi:hypothetical protein
MAFDFPSSPTVGQQYTPVAGTTYTYNGVGWTLVSGGGIGNASAQGRLTLQTATPVMTTTQSAKTAIYYTPYVGNQIPIYDGTNMVATPFTELSVATTDTSKSPAAIGASKVNDWFVWNDAGTIRIGHGPDWTSDTVRSAGTALVMVNGIWLNNAAITNGPAASRGTYVATTRSNASSTLDWIYGGLAAGGTAGFFGLWNAYNRVQVGSITGNTTDNWGAAGGSVWEAANASTAMRCSLVRGLDEDIVFAQYTCMLQANGANATVGVGLDRTTGFNGVATGVLIGTATYQTGVGTYNGLPGIGLHYLQAVQFATSTTTYLGDGSTVYIQTGLSTQFRA